MSTESEGERIVREQLLPACLSTPGGQPFDANNLIAAIDEAIAHAINLSRRNDDWRHQHEMQRQRAMRAERERDEANEALKEETAARLEAERGERMATNLWRNWRRAAHAVDAARREAESE